MLNQPRSSGGLDTPPLHQHPHEPQIAPWQNDLPALRGKQVTLREVCAADASALWLMLKVPEVQRFLYEPPGSIDAFERFISWSRQQRASGQGACFVVTVPKVDTAIGLFQVRAERPDFSVAEWGFAIGSPFWGTGVFQDSAELVLQFVFDTLRVQRLEATAAVRNGRGDRALLKVGAVQEGVIRNSLLRDGVFLDQVLYSIREADYRASRRQSRPFGHRSVH